MSLHFTRPLPSLAPLAATAFCLLAMIGTPGMARSTPLSAVATPDDETSLLLARDRSAHADAAVDALKHALTPGHLTDPTPEADAAYGLETLRGEVADLERKAAGYRATLGDRHPTLVGTEEVMAEFRTQLQDATRKALASAQREAATARTAASEIDRRLSARAGAPSNSVADATGSIASPQIQENAPTIRPPATRHPAALPRDRSVNAAAASEPGGLDRPRRLSAPLIAVAAGALALLLAAGALRLLRAIRTGARRPAARVEPAMATVISSAEPAVADLAAHERPAAPGRDTVPVLATLPLPRSNAAADVAALFARDPDGALAGAAAALHATLRDAVPGEPGGRLTVLLFSADGLTDSDGDLAALALALAAAATGRRAVILEARAVGRLRHALVPAETAPILVEVGGTERTLYRVDAGVLTIAVLPTDLGEAEAAANASLRPQTGRFRGLDAFDMVVLVGDDSASLARAADVVVVTASETASPESISVAARPCRDAGRVCGALILARAATAQVVAMRTTTRRRVMSDPAQISPARIGLRGSIAPSRRHAGR